MSEKKLYRVEIRTEFFAYTATAADAIDLAEDAVRDAGVYDCAIPVPVEYREHAYFADNWEATSLVYTTDGEDITLGEIIEKLPKKNGDKK